MLGQTRLEFIFGVIIFSIVILYIVSQINSTFSTIINDYETDSLKAQALNIIKTIVETGDVQRNYTVEVPVDVIMINDISTSMDGDGTTTCKITCGTSGNPTACVFQNGCTCPNCNDCDNNGYNADTGESPCSINDARNAAKVFVDLLDSINDQSGLVVFNRSAYHKQNLTSDKNTVKNAIDNIRTSDDTGIAYGIGNATEELKSVRARTGIAKKVEILLTDGRDYPSLTNTEDAAQEAADNNITIYTIGVGSTSYLDENVLKSIASVTGGKYYYVPSSDQLAGIYQEIAYEIKTESIVIGIISNKPYNVSQEKVYNLSQSCGNLNSFGLETYRLKIYNSTNLLLLCGTSTLKPPKVFVSKYVLIENDLGNVTLEVW